MLRLILGRAGTGKTGQIMDEIAASAARGEGGNLLIVPEQYSHEAERELARRCGSGGSLYAEVLSFTRLAYRVSVELGGSARVYMDAGGRLLQLALALSQVGNSLRVYGGALRRPEQMDLLLSALDELRRGRAGTEALRAAAEKTGGALRVKLEDLALLREAMDALEERSGADPASRLEILAQQIPACAFLRGARIYIDGFTDFTAQEREVLRALCRSAEVTVCLSCDGMEDSSEVFALSRRAARQLLEDVRADGGEVKIVTVPSRRDGTPLGQIERQLFGWTEEVFDSGGQIRLVTAGTVAEECELAAAEALRLAREDGSRWRDIAIAVRGFGEYAPLLEETFRRYGVPLYASTRTDIMARPLPAMMRAAFDLLADGWSYESVFTYLKTGLPGLGREDCDLLENYVITWSLRGSAWTREAPWRQHPEGIGAKATENSEALLRRLDELRRQAAAPLIHLAERGAAAADALGQCRAVAAFWEELALPERLEARAAELEQAGEARLAAETRQLWELTVSALEQCAAVLGEMPMDQETFGKLFCRMLSRYDVGTIPVALDRVTAGDFDRMRRRSIRHLLVLGATDERLPRIGGESGVFTDAERDELRSLWERESLGIELAPADDALDREFNLIYNVLTLPGESLYLSRSLQEGGGDTRPSFLTERVARLFVLKEERGDVFLARRSALAPAMELAARGDPEAAAYFSAGEESAARLARLRAAAEYARGRLARESVRALYGERLWLTATRVDNIASCKFKYFLEYGLRAKPRRKADFAPPELGTFLHYLLENVGREAAALGGFGAVSDETITELTDRFTEEYVHRTLEDYREKSPRFIYLFKRVAAAARKIVLDVARELRESDFQPLDFELNFSGSGDMPPVMLGEGAAALALTGVADRVDGWEKDGKLYIRVVDYKSGEKKFSLTDVWYGMGLQMLLYLFSLERNGRARYGREILPAGVLYVPARDALVSADERLTDAEILQRKAAGKKRSGLLLNDEGVLNAMEHGEKFTYLPVSLNRKDGKKALATAQQLSQLSRYIDETLMEMARELHSGSIAADPWFQNERDNTCLYCDYFEACHFDENTDCRRRKNRIDPEEFWRRLEERGGNANAPD